MMRTKSAKRLKTNTTFKEIIQLRKMKPLLRWFYKYKQCKDND